jgi:hypothetical protein
VSPPDKERVSDWLAKAMRLYYKCSIGSFVTASFFFWHRLFWLPTRSSAPAFIPTLGFLPFLSPVTLSAFDFVAIFSFFAVLLHAFVAPVFGTPIFGNPYVKPHSAHPLQHMD